MKISDLTESHFRRYFESRLAENKLRKSGNGYTALCCFHQDRTPSLSVSFEKGVWKCHSGCGSGGIIEFEQKFSSSDKDAALSKIADIVGESHLNFSQAPEAVYPYTDAFGKLLFQVVRYPGKRFVQRHPDGKGGWIYKTQGMKMVLYNLPDVAAARNIIVAEGEKDADNLKAAFEAKPPTLAVTTSPRGAGKWLDDFSVYMAGKQVVIIPDNDEAGKKHAQAVAQSCYRWAQGIKILELPGLSEKGDASDFLKTHQVSEILELSKKTDWWKPPLSETTLFMNVSQFLEKSADHIEWLVEGVIQKGANGMVIAKPKSGKSFAIQDLAVALASGQKWLDFFVPRRVKTALVSREDHSGLTQWRKRKILTARKLAAQDLDGYLYINAKGLKPKVMLDYPDDVSALIADLKRYETEFLILDVMRVLHGSDENDNTEMQKIIDILNHIHGETGASVCLIHHDNKRDEGGSITERVRGASSIAGWTEFLGWIRVVDVPTLTREFSCDIKADQAPAPFYWRIVDTEDNGVALTRVEWEAQQQNGRRKKSKDGEEVPF